MRRKAEYWIEQLVGDTFSQSWEPASRRSTLPKANDTFDSLKEKHPDDTWRITKRLGGALREVVAIHVGKREKKKAKEAS